jgi:hypothetical protein
VLKDTIIILDYITLDGKIESKNGNGWARMGSVPNVRVLYQNLFDEFEEYYEKPSVNVVSSEL